MQGALHRKWMHQGQRQHTGIFSLAYGIFAQEADIPEEGKGCERPKNSHHHPKPRSLDRKLMQQGSKGCEVWGGGGE